MASESEIHELIVCSRAATEREASVWDEYHSWYVGDDQQTEGEVVSPTVGGDSAVARDDLQMRHNYTYAFIDTMIANVCPTAPALTINTPDEALRATARAREMLINATFRRNKLHDTLWRASSHTAISGRCPVKVVWDYRRQIPTVRVVDPRAFFFDMSLPFAETRYVCEAVPITWSQWQARGKRGSDYKYDKAVYNEVKPTGYPDWLRTSDGRGTRQRDPTIDTLKWVLIYEFYDFETGTYYHFADGHKEPLYAGQLPYRYSRNPYALLVFNDNLRNSGGLSDIKLISGLQRRLDELDTLQLQFVHACIPAMLLNDTMIDNPEGLLTQLSSGHGPNDIIHFKTVQPVDIRAVMMPKPLPQAIPPIEKIREEIEANIEFTIGLPTYARGGVGGAEIATELALADTATRTRNGRRERILGDLVTEIGRRVGALWQEYLSYEDRKIPIYLEDAKDPTFIDAGAFDVSADQENVWEDSWFFSIEAVPFSPTENHRLVQLNKLQAFMESFLVDPNIDKRKLTERLLELLGMDNLLAENPAPSMPPGAQPPGGAPVVPPPGGDNILTGAMPQGTMDVEEFNTADTHALANQAAVTTR